MGRATSESFSRRRPSAIGLEANRARRARIRHRTWAVARPEMDGRIDAVLVELGIVAPCRSRTPGPVRRRAAARGYRQILVMGTRRDRARRTRRAARPGRDAALAELLGELAARRTGRPGRRALGGSSGGRRGRSAWSLKPGRIAAGALPASGTRWLSPTPPTMDPTGDRPQACRSSLAFDEQAVADALRRGPLKPLPTAPRLKLGAPDLAGPAPATVESEVWCTATPVAWKQCAAST